MTKIVLLIALAALTMAVCSTAALAAVRTGGPGDDVLVGTKYNDRITGNGGIDHTLGKKGNDTYVYKDGWGVDSVIDPRGKDTLNFSAVTTALSVRLCLEVSDSYMWATSGPDAVAVSGVLAPDGSLVAAVENVKGGSGDDVIWTCSGTNRLSGGPGSNQLTDLAGHPTHGLPGSNDVYSVKGESANFIYDTGGSADVLDMRPLRSNQVQRSRDDNDGDGTANSLALTYGDGQYGAIVINHFGDDNFDDNFQGGIEKVIFKDKTVKPTAAWVDVTSSTRSAATFDDRSPEDKESLDLTGDSGAR